ncbi:GGDEF domain-containing protein [Endozoicomonas sp. G2_1]|uniref:GGDEF domain-containing protein n=1 Tax=Endozoicomonas sp. G2_1 TaxID=2821091 RepID=UPI001ADB12EA|nr:GGDEF domain-containing protein [Endozoicomonas sp. G2_1]MBO9489361.1 GGDEF domain-containing protein [Endozoicomonas sp. G2_1]
MSQYLLKIGRLRLTLLITLISIVCSVAITLTILTIGLGKISPIGLIISIVAPLVIAPLMSWHVIGLMLKVARLEHDMRQLATYDQLTQLLSRTVFIKRASTLLNRYQKQQRAITFAYLDIDNFKLINDNYGHSAGDQVIASLGKLIITKTTGNDLSGRLGGEEFIICIPDLDLADATAVIEELLTAIRQSSVQCNNLELSYTVSVGVTHTNSTSTQSLEELIKRADQALYQAKRTGKDKLVIV